MKTTEEYLKSSSCCPFCDSFAIQSGSLEVGGHTAERIISCNDCSSRWIEIFTLTDFIPTDQGANENAEI